MAQVKKGGAHGLWKVCAQLVGADGISYGIAGSGLANGANTTPRILHYPKEAGIPIPDRTTIDFTGGDRWITSYQYGLNSLGSFNFSIQDVDADFIAMCTGTNVDQTTNTEWTEYTEDLIRAEFPQLSLMFIYRLQSFEPATFGQTFYVQSIVPRAWVAPQGLQGAPSYQSPGTYQFQVTPSSNGKHIHGTNFGANLGATDNIVALYHVISSNPLAMAVGRSDGTSYTVVGAVKSKVETVGTAAATKNMVTKIIAAGTVTAGVADAIDQDTAEFDVGTALTVASSDLVTVLYESDGYITADPAA